MGRMAAILQAWSLGGITADPRGSLMSQLSASIQLSNRDDSEDGIPLSET